MKRELKPPQIVAISFLCAIVIGALLLKVPVCVKAGENISLIDSLFTATSATCVTGLIVQDTGTYFSPIGKTILFMLIQMGGLGIMTFSTLFAIVLGRKLSIHDNMIIQRALDHKKIQGLKNLILHILGITFGLEFLGALALFLRWGVTTSWTVQERFFNATFHSVSAFCNAGFSFFKNSFEGYAGDNVINIIMMLLIFLGGIGFVVMLEIPKLFSFGDPRKKINVQAKLALSISIILIVAGALFMFFAEKDNTLAGMSMSKKITVSLFQSVTARTAGFNTVKIQNLMLPTMTVMVFLMFIGASPGSTGGGIKTCTFGIIIATLRSMLVNKDRVTVFKKTMSQPVVRRAMVVVLLAIAWIFCATLILTVSEQRYLIANNKNLIHVLFEVTSAFGTVGLSTGITQHLTAVGKLVLIFTMYFGRVGPLTLALSIALKKDKNIYSYPEERIMVG